MLLLSESDVAALVDPDLLIEAAEEAYTALSLGAAEVPLRGEILRRDPEHVILTMPGLIEGRVFGAKLVASRASPDPAAGPRITAFVLLFDVRANAPLGLVAAAHLTDLRTAAGLAAATKVLAREDCRTLTVFGAGRLALPSIELVCHVRPIDRLFVVGRSRARIEALARTVTARLGSRLTTIVTHALPAAAAAAADVIVTVTSSGAPVFDGRAVRPGTHLNLGGAFRPDTREVDDAVARRALFFVDGLESCLARAGDLVLPMREGALARSAVRGEIGAVLGGQLPGRQRPDEITVFKSLGSAVQDLVLGARLLARAEQRGLGLRFDPG
jgi:ornithine cyclodeaminase/alanine dehydrogenase-like protein (mu-crystallin family)